MAAANLTEVGPVIIDGKPYSLVRIEGRPQSHRGYSLDHVDEPPYDGGAPAMLHDPQYTWHLGGLKSRQGLQGTSEYGQNTDPRWAGRLLPSAKINDVSLPGSDATATCIFEAMGYLFAVCGRRIFRVDPATNTAVVSKDFGGSVNGVMGLRWEEDYALVTTDAATQSLWSLSLADVVGGGNDGWVQTADVSAYRLAAGINRLFRIDQDGLLSNISSGLDPMSEANWADAVDTTQVGFISTVPTALLAYERTVFAGKPEGLYAVGDEGFGEPQIGRMVKDDANCKGMALFDPYVLVPHSRGLYRFLPGDVTSAGLEKELLNESPVHGRWQGFAMDGSWIYGLLAVGSATYVMVGRERTGNESGWGPFVWDTWLYFDAASEAGFCSALVDPIRFWFGKGNDLAYVELNEGPGAAEYCLSANRYSVKYRFDDWGPKAFEKIDVVGKGLSSTVYWTVNYAIDGGSYSNLDATGAVMKADSDGRHVFVLPTSAVGREIQYRFDYTSDDAEDPGELNFVEPFAVPQSRKIPLVSCYLRLAVGIMHDRARESRAAVEQFNDLEALIEQAAPVTASGPWGKDKSAYLRKLRITDTLDEGAEPPSFLVELGMQLREEAA